MYAVPLLAYVAASAQALPNAIPQVERESDAQSPGTGPEPRGLLVPSLSLAAVKVSLCPGLPIDVCLRPTGARIGIGTDRVLEVPVDE